MDTDGVPPGDTLSGRTMATLRAFFDQQNHKPSEEHWRALEDIADTLEQMADIGCERLTYLSAVDAGVGKTKTVTHFARALVQDSRYLDVGMVVCVGRIAEAVSLARSLGLPRESFAVLTSDEKANSLGNPEPTAAQVLITTQQRIERSCDGRTFAEVKAFHYGRHGARQVRAWDEAWLPGCTATVTGDDLLLLVKPMRVMSPAFAVALKRFANSLDDYGDGDVVDVPDFEAAHGVSLWDVLAAVSARIGRLQDDQQSAAVALKTLSGRRVRVRHDDMSGNTVLTYRDTLPADLAPMIVLDASGRVRETYRYIEDHRRSLVRLHEAVKDYSPLHVHVWRKSGSKSGFSRHGEELVAGIVKTILTKPSEPWLIVTHKPGWKVGDVGASIRRQLPADVSAQVRMIGWGEHMATNEYADVPNVILAGTIFLRHSQYTALTHLGQGLDVASGFATPEDVRRTERGEHANFVLQALCRGRVRKSDGDRCLPMDAFIIASTASGIPDDLSETIFPGCQVTVWDVGRRELKGKQSEAVRFIEKTLSTAHWVSYRDVARGIAMDWPNFRKLVTDHRDWPIVTADRHLSECQGPRNARGVCRTAMLGTVRAA